MKTRIMFDFTGPALKRLNELVKITGAPNRAEVVRRALALYDQAIHVVKDNKICHISKKDKTSFEIE
jgi:hypothetical protein